MSELKVTDIERGKTYRGKHPKRVGFDGCFNDRTVIWLSPLRTRVQYDGPAVADGRRYPMVTMHKFLQWASHEVETNDGSDAGNEVSK